MKMKSTSARKWGLALGGGGARGIAHIGVLKALEGAGLVPDVIAGTSIGALVGGAYACEPDAQALERRLLRILSPHGDGNKPLRLIAQLNIGSSLGSTMMERMLRSLRKEILFGLVMFRSSIWSADDLRTNVAAFLPDVDLAETRIPFAPLAVDMVTGRPWLPEDGSVVEAVMASCAVPGFMPPVRKGDALLMDGALADLIPAEAARRRGARVVVGVDVSNHLSDQCPMEDGMDAIKRATEVMMYHMGNAGRSRSDLLIEPLDGHVEWTDFESCEALIRCGFDAASRALKDMEDLLGL